MGFFRYLLLRNRVLVTIALFAALWFALPVLEALAVPPDNGPIPGSATAVQDPPGSCPGRPNTIAFPATVQIQGGVLHITDPGGETSGTINADGTADLNGQGESYALLSSQGTTLNLLEVNGGCNFRTTIVLDRVLYQVPTEPPSTQVSETAAQPTVSGTPGGVIVPETSSGGSLTWLWVTGAVAGVGVLGGGLWFYLRQPVTITDVATDCPEERERVRRAFEQTRRYLEAEYELDAKEEARDAARDKLDFERETGQAERDFHQAEADVRVALHNIDDFDDYRKELDDALLALAKCLGEPPLKYGDPDARRSALTRLGLLPKPAGFDPVPPTDSPPPGGFDPVPPSLGSGDEGDDRQEIG